MNVCPTLNTKRLVLRQFKPEEAMVVRTLAGEYEIAHGCLAIPHPYEPGMAEAWIGCHEGWFYEREELVFAITRKEDGCIIGATGLMIEQDYNRAEIGYWIGIPFWGQGYANETAEAATGYAFDDLHIKRVTALYFNRNPASERVLEKPGMKQEGLLRKHILNDGIYEDVITCGIREEEWRALSDIHHTPTGEIYP